MKKIVMGAAALLCAASMFAVDFAATVHMGGDIAGGAVTEDTSDATYIWKLNKTDQKDADALKLSVNGDKAGANFQFWYNYSGSDADLKVRSTSIWVKPIDQLKITIGDVSCATLKNTLDYWKDPVGGWVTNIGYFYDNYSSYASVEGAGIAAELTPIEGLTVVAGIAAGAGNNFITFTEGSDKAAVKAYGASINYNLSAAAGIPVNVAVSWRDAGNDLTSDSVKVLAVGADYGNAYADGFYGMINARMHFSRGLMVGKDWSNAGTLTYYNKDKSVKLDAIAIDNFFQFKSGAMTIALRAPVVIRGLAGELENGTKLDASYDPSYMFWSLKFSYALDGLTVYVAAGSDYDDGTNGWVFLKEKAENTFNVTIHPGVTFNVGACAFDIGARFDIKDAELKTGSTTEYYRPFAWSIPFTATIGF